MAFCIQCGHLNPDEGRFCDQCGNPLVWEAKKVEQQKCAHPSTRDCPACGNASSSDKFCTNCGHKFVATPAPVAEPIDAEPAISPVVELPLTTSSAETEPQESGLGDERNPKSRIVPVLGIVGGLVALGIAAYVIMSPSSSKSSPLPAASIESQPAERSTESSPPLDPRPALPLSTEAPPSPLVENQPAKPPLPTAVPAVPRTAPATPKTMPPLKEKPGPLPQASSSKAEKPAGQEVLKQFSCGDLPFGLRIPCSLEGTGVIRKCAPDLKTWNHDIPGCNRQGSTTNIH